MSRTDKPCGDVRRHADPTLLTIEFPAPAPGGASGSGQEGVPTTVLVADAEYVQAPALPRENSNPWEELADPRPGELDNLPSVGDHPASDIARPAPAGDNPQECVDGGVAESPPPSPRRRAAPADADVDLRLTGPDVEPPVEEDRAAPADADVKIELRQQTQTWNLRVT